MGRSVVYSLRTKSCADFTKDLQVFSALHLMTVHLFSGAGADPSSHPDQFLLKPGPKGPSPKLVAA